MAPGTDPILLEIKSTGDELNFILEYRGTGLPARMAFKATQYQLLIKQVDAFMFGGAFDRGSGGITVERPALNGTQFFSKLGALLLPIPLQRELRRLATRNARLMIRTECFNLPWEMLEIPAFFCPDCQAELVETPACPACQRALLPDDLRAQRCACGSELKRLPKINCPACGKIFFADEMQMKPSAHLGLSFAMEREYKTSLPAAPYAGAHDLRPLKVLLIENPGGLSFTDREFEELRSFFENNRRIIQADVLQRENATRSSIEHALKTRGPYDIVHFIGHAFFDMQTPQESYLALANDTRLALGEVQGLFAGQAPELVILNGCQTALVSEQDGRELGFPTQFRAIGCRSFIGTLSSVSDPQSCYLMLYLYQELLQGEPLGKALTEAKRKLTQRDFADIENQSGLQLADQAGFQYSWSAYILYGDGQLSLRHFDLDLSWKKLARTSAEHALAASGGEAPVGRQNAPKTALHPAIDLSSKFLLNRDRPIQILPGLDRTAFASITRYLVGLGRHIVASIDLRSWDGREDLEAYLTSQVWKRPESLNELLPYLEQMSTDESAVLVLVDGFRNPLLTKESLGQINRLAQEGRGFVKILLNVDLGAAASLLAGADLRRQHGVYNFEGQYSNARQQARNRLQEWGRSLAANELIHITRDKWNPGTPELYITRQDIEAQIDSFLQPGEGRLRGFCVLGETGRGKTNLLCRTYQKIAAQSSKNLCLPLFFTAKGLLDLTNGTSQIRAFLERSLVQAVFRQEGNFAQDQPARLADLFAMLGNVEGSRVELVLMVDAINELPQEHLDAFLEGLQSLMDDVRELPLYSRLELAVIVSSRTFAWRDYWSSREHEHQNYFQNLDLDDNGDFQENLLDFDVHDEACEAYRRAGLNPPWDQLDDALKELCRTPFFLHIIRTVAHVLGGNIFNGSYDEIMRRYAEIVLLRHQNNFANLERSEIRKALLDRIIFLLSGDDQKPGSPLRYEVSYLELRQSVAQISPDEIRTTMRQLCDESVLEMRGDQIRIAFDRFFDFLFQDYLRRRAELDPNLDWSALVERYHPSEYHRHGVSAALAFHFNSLGASGRVTGLLANLIECSSGNLPSFRQVVQEACFMYGESAPLAYSEVMQTLYSTVENPLLVLDMACRIVASRRINSVQRAPLVRVIEQIVKASLSGGSKAQNPTLRRNLVNVIAGLAHSDDDLEILFDVLRAIIGVDRPNGVLKQTLNEILNLIMQPDFEHSLSLIRKKTLKQFKESDDRRAIMFRFIGAALLTPQFMVSIIRNRRLIRYLKHVPEVLQRFSIGLEIIYKGVTMWLSAAKSSDKSELSVMTDIVDRLLFDELFVVVRDVYHSQHDNPEYQEEFSLNAGFIVGLIGFWPEINRLLSYSEHGLDYVTPVLKQGKGAELSEMLGLIDIDLPMSSVHDATNRLRALFLTDDAYQNYMGMTITAVQGTRDFNQVEAILTSLVSEPDTRMLQVNGKAIPHAMKVSREVFSIFTFMIRRSASRHSDQLPHMINFIQNILDGYFTFDPKAYELPVFLRHFLQMELFGHEDPFNPLLSLAVASRYQGNSAVSALEYANYPNELIRRFAESSFPEKYQLIDRVLRELVPMAYFAPFQVFGTLQEILIEQFELIRTQPPVRASVVAVIRNLNVIVSSQVAKMFAYLDRYAANLSRNDIHMSRDFTRYISDLQTDGLGTPLSENEIEYLYRSTDVFGGHETVTIVFIEFDNIRKFSIPFLQNELLHIETGSELTMGFFTSLLKLLTSSEIDFSLGRLFFNLIP